MSRANPATTHDNAGIAAWSFKLRAEIGSYKDCEQAYAGLTSGRLGPHMDLLRYLHSGHYAIALYDTEIIRYYPDGTFSVDNGGWATPTTMYRLNAVLPPEYHVFHKDKQLSLHHGSAPPIWPATHDKRVSIDTGEIVS